MLDVYTLEPIKGGTITLWRSGPFYKDTLSATDGFYRMDFEPYDYFYKVSAVADKYFTNKNIGAWPPYYETGRPTGERVAYSNEANYIDIKLPPEGFILYQLKQVKPYSGSIQVRLTPDNYNGVISYNGQGLHTEYMDRIPGGTKHRVLVSIIWNNDSITTYNDSLFVPRFDAIKHLIEFSFNYHPI